MGSGMGQRVSRMSVLLLACKLRVGAAFGVLWFDEVGSGLDAGRAPGVESKEQRSVLSVQHNAGRRGR